VKNDDLEKARDLENEGLNKTFTSDDFVKGMIARIERTGL
jgi:hypothetical protein